jgi:mRNA-degrading endonuclease RelE of RelBE toxin-antitoxin system
MTRQVSQSPLFARQKKHLNKAEIEELDQEISNLQKNAKSGEPKKGDLTGIHVHKFKAGKKLFLLAYEFDERELFLVSLGPHENFYRDLKRYIR